MGEEVHTVKEGDSMDVNQVRELVKLVEESGVTEVIVEEGDSRVIIRRGAASAEAVAVQPVHGAAPARVAATPASPESPQVIGVGDQPNEPLEAWHAVVAPMVGTFYATPSPGADPFVRVGEHVAEGQPLCILEAMKLMNEITAEEPGIIRKVCLASGTPVEYGTVLFYYEPVA
jgi:oxaloacetate decarboxylase alpha subunit